MDELMIERQIRRLQDRQSVHNRLVLQALDEILAHLGLRDPNALTLTQLAESSDRRDFARELSLVEQRTRRAGTSTP